MQINSVFNFRVVVSGDELDSRDDGASESKPFVIEESMGYLVNYLSRTFAHALAERLATQGASLGQWAVLMFLWARDGQSQGELSRRVAIEDATMVRTIDRMERDGLVQRVRNTRDRRRIDIFLTDKGRSLRDSLVPCAIAVNEAATQPFTDAEKQQLSDLLRRMIESLESTPSMKEKGTGRVRAESIE